MDDAITEDGSADRLFLLMLYTGARAMDGPDDRDVALADSVSSHGTRGYRFDVQAGVGTNGTRKGLRKRPEAEAARGLQ